MPSNHKHNHNNFTNSDLFTLIHLTKASFCSARTEDSEMEDNLYPSEGGSCTCYCCDSQFKRAKVDAAHYTLSPSVFTWRYTTSLFLYSSPLPFKQATVLAGSSRFTSRWLAEIAAAIRQAAARSN